MTGYRLEIGYNSAGPKKDQAWQVLKAAALMVCANPQRLYDEVIRLEPLLAGDALIDYATAYQKQDDLTITFHEEPSSHESAEDFTPYIHQLASGGGEAREIKEACRRAFCRLVIQAMHRERIEVNLHVS